MGLFSKLNCIGKTPSTPVENSRQVNHHAPPGSYGARAPIPAPGLPPTRAAVTAISGRSSQRSTADIAGIGWVGQQCHHFNEGLVPNDKRCKHCNTQNTAVSHVRTVTNEEALNRIKGKTSAFDHGWYRTCCYTHQMRDHPNNACTIPGCSKPKTANLVYTARVVSKRSSTASAGIPA